MPVPRDTELQAGLDEGYRKKTKKNNEARPFDRLESSFRLYQK